MRLLAAASASASGSLRNACTALSRGTTRSIRVGLWLTTESTSSERETALAQVVAQPLEHERVQVGSDAVSARLRLRS